MKSKKMVIVAASVIGILATSVTAFAAGGFGTPAEILAGLTGQSVETVTAERTESGKTYGQIAGEAGVLSEFKAEKLEQRKEILEERVADGTLTQERADQIIAAMEENQATCDGSGSGMRIGAGSGGMNGGNRMNGGNGGNGMNGGNGGNGGRNGSGMGTGICQNA